MSDDKPRLSWREIDRRRSGSQHRSDEPRGKRAQQEKAHTDQRALKEADALFSQGPGGATGERLARQIRDSHGSPEFLPACRQYREEIGVPADPGLLSLFLDTAERDLVTEALEAFLAIKKHGSFEIPSGLRSQLRVLEHDPDDTIAGISEELLEG